MNHIKVIADKICSHDAMDAVHPLGMESFKEHLIQELAVLVQAASMDSSIVNDAFTIEIK